jgi:hypothetical protein
MNGSQLLYKISDLQYRIRMKEVECARAAKAGDQFNIDSNNAALRLLKEDLALKVKAFNSIPPHSPNNLTKGSKKTKWWQGFFNLKAAFKK